MSIVWIDIWDIQSGSNAKMLINRCFNIGRYIITIWEANMNPGIPQCKNCWKWGHVTFSCRIQGSKCIKCNGPHKSKNHHEFWWCCKANAKINPLRLETKKEKLCLHSFKCLNCYECQDWRRWTWFILFFFSFLFSFWFIFLFFLFLEQLGLGLISHAVTTVTW